MKWYKQSSSEYLNADFRNSFSIKQDDNTKVFWRDVAFLCGNGLLSFLKQKISDNLDLKKAVVEYGKYLTTISMDKSLFSELVKCKDWDIIIKLMSMLNNGGSNIAFYENGEIIQIDIPNILKELDTYSARAYKEKLKAGEVLECDNNVGLDKNTLDSKASDLNLPTQTSEIDLDMYITETINPQMKLCRHTHKETGEEIYTLNCRKISRDKFLTLES